MDHLHVELINYFEKRNPVKCKDIPCKYHNDGRCWYGDRCWFSHSILPNQNNLSNDIISNHDHIVSNPTIQDSIVNSEDTSMVTTSSSINIPTAVSIASDNNESKDNNCNDVPVIHQIYNHHPNRSKKKHRKNKKQQKKNQQQLKQMVKTNHNSLINNKSFFLYIGNPSKSTIDAFDASELTSQFHIIHPHVVK